MALKIGLKPCGASSMPSGWIEKMVGDVAQLATGSTPPTADATNYGDDFMFVSPADIDESKWINRTVKRLSSKGFSISRQFPPGSVLFVCIGSTIGKCAMAKVELTSNQQINAVLPNPTFDSEFLYYSLSMSAPAVKAQAGEQAVPLVNKTQFAATKLLLPPIEEQRAIATVLSDVDALIAGLERLIAKKRNIKQAAMQQLLTGQTRLPGFNGEWEVSELRQCARFCSGTYLAQGVYRDGSFEVQGAGGSMGKHVAANFAEPVSVIGRVGTVGRPRFMPFGCWVNNNAGAIVALPGKAVPRFVHLLLLTMDWSKATSVTAQPFLVIDSLMKMKFRLPQEPEQTAIAEVLAEMDAELAVLEQQREKSRTLKQAMMQELLTGRTRLV